MPLTGLNRNHSHSRLFPLKFQLFKIYFMFRRFGFIPTQCYRMGKTHAGLRNRIGRQWEIGFDSLSFNEVVKTFLGNYKDPDFENIVGNMLANLKALGCSLSLKLHFLNSHLSYFPENLGSVSEKRGEIFHQDIKEMERRYHGRWNVYIIVDYCWMLHREEPQAVRIRKSSKRSLELKKKILLRSLTLW